MFNQKAEELQLKLKAVEVSQKSGPCKSQKLRLTLELLHLMPGHFSGWNSLRLAQL